MTLFRLLKDSAGRVAVVVLMIAAVALSGMASDYTVKLKRKSGVYYIPCIINGVKKDFIFDTGAAKTSLSQEFANELIAKRVLSRNDFKGTTQTRNANGVVDNNATVVLRQVKVGNRLLTNVEAIIAVSQKAPLLLGLNVIDHLGDWTISRGYLKLHNTAESPEVNGRSTVPGPAGIIYIDGDGDDDNDDDLLENANGSTEKDGTQTSIRVLAYKGDPEAQYQLGMIYLRGDGVEVNGKLAVEWFRRSAEQGHKAAQLALADCYTYGWGVEVDESKAEYWRNLSYDSKY